MGGELRSMFVCISNNHYLSIPMRCHAPLYNVNQCEVSGIQMQDLRPTVMS